MAHTAEVGTHSPPAAEMPCPPRPSPQPVSNLVVAQEALLDCELFRTLPICLCSLWAATGTANRKNYWFETANLSSVRVKMQLCSYVQWGGLMLILEIGKTTIMGLNSRKMPWFLTYERENSIPCQSLTHFRDPEPFTLFCTVCEGLKSFSTILNIILLL